MRAQSQGSYRGAIRSASSRTSKASSQAPASSNGIALKCSSSAAEPSASTIRRASVALATEGARRSESNRARGRSAVRCATASSTVGLLVVSASSAADTWAERGEAGIALREVSCERKPCRDVDPIDAQADTGWSS